MLPSKGAARSFTRHRTFPCYHISDQLPNLHYDSRKTRFYMERKPDTGVLDHVCSHWVSLKGQSPIYHFLLENVDIVTAGRGWIEARLKILPIHLNSEGTLHGTVSACLTDWAGGLAIASTGLEKTGVSTDIHTSYISTAKEHDLLVIEGNATKVGLTMAYTTVSIQSLMTMVRKRQSRMAHI